MDYVLKRTYFSQDRVIKFLWDLMHTTKLVGDDPSKFWRNVKFLEIQEEGESQTELLALFNRLLATQYGFGIDKCGENASTFLYLDDGVFTGDRVRGDLRKWVVDEAPPEANLHVAAIALHSGGEDRVNEHIKRATTTTGKTIKISWWYEIELEDRKVHRHEADVLYPAGIPDDPAVLGYIRKEKYKPSPRRSGNIGEDALYRNDRGKRLLELEFLKAGAHIRQLCPKLGPMQKPLGYTPYDKLGFGSLIITYRNCPNNVPLALWADHPWYPLFPRVTHNKAEIQRRIAHLKGED